MSVLSPEGYDSEKIEQILEQKRSWIYRNLAEWEDLNRAHVERQFVSGEGLPYLGSNYGLKLVDDQQEDQFLKNGYFLMSRDKADRGMELQHHWASCSTKGNLNFH